MNPFRTDEEITCLRYEREELFNRELGLEPSEHVKTCPSCSALADKYRRLDRALVDLGADSRPAGDWQTKVRARILNDRPRQRERSRNPLLMGIAIASVLASAGAVAYVAMRSQHTPAPPLSVEPPIIRFEQQAPVVKPKCQPPGPNVDPFGPPVCTTAPPPPPPRAVAAELISEGSYLLFNRPADYGTATATCAKLKGHLVTIETETENKALRSLAVQAVKSPYGWSDAWIGLDENGSQGTYAWIDGKPTTFTNWSPGEPNHGANSVAEHCAVYKGSTIEGAWDDRPCAIAYPFICELPPKIESRHRDSPGSL